MRSVSATWFLANKRCASSDASFASIFCLSWVGSGRLIFSHNYTEKDFRAVAERFVAAAEAMQADGWWWTAPAADNKGIRRAILREALAVRFGRRGAAVSRPA